MGLNTVIDILLAHAMSTPIQRRQEYVNAIAASRGVSQPAEKRYVFTRKGWLDWYAEHPLSRADMDAAMWQWKQDFPVNPGTLENIEAWEEEGTRSSKTSEGPSQRCFCGISSADVPD